ATAARTGPCECSAPLLGRLPALAAAHDQFGRRLLAPTSLGAFRLSPRRDRRTAARGLALTTTQRVVDRVHRHATDVRTTALPAVLAGLADREQLVLCVAHLADRGEAATVHHPHLAALETQRDVITLAGNDLGTLTGGTRHRATLADLGLDVVHHGTQRDLRQRHRVANPHVAARTAHHGVTLGETLRVQDVALLAVGVHQQRDARGAVRIVLDLGHAGRDPELVPLEVDPAVHPLVTTTAVTHRELAGVVAAATLLER